MTIRTNFTLLEKINLWFLFGHWIPNIIYNAREDDSNAAYVVKLKGDSVFIAWGRAEVIKSVRA